MTDALLIKGHQKETFLSTMFPTAHDILFGNCGNRFLASNAVNYILVPTKQMAGKAKAKIYMQNEQYPTLSTDTHKDLLSDFSNAGIELLQFPMKKGTAYVVRSKIATIDETDFDDYSHSPIIKFFDGSKIKSNKRWEGPESLSPWRAVTSSAPSRKLGGMAV